MQTTYRFKAKEISMAFIKSLKTLFADQEVEIIVKTINPTEKKTVVNKGILEMIEDNRKKAPTIASDINIRGLIDNAHYPSN
jgi:hypothetical protein